MNISISWLQRFFQEPLDPKATIDLLTNAGLEVDAVEKLYQDLDDVVVAQIDSFEQHPDADKLSLCKISDGEQTNDVICGASNFKQGDKVALAKIGAQLPNGLKIKKSKIRGVPSHGMLCSLEELALSDASEGIWILPNDAPLGKTVTQVMGLEDTCLTLDLTPNRGDCFHHLGVAREIAAIQGTNLQSQAAWMATQKDFSFDIHIEDLDRCPYYSLTRIEDVKVAESPRWLSQFLKTVGVRPTNNVVDVTNWILMDRGQPLHAFDADLVQGSIKVRQAQEGETLVCLDEQERTLTSEDLVIADEQGPIAIAGVMGGLRTSVTEKTKHVLLESAWFSPGSVRKTSKRLHLISESSKRFEREIDGSKVLSYGLMAAGMLEELAQGAVVGTAEKGKLFSNPHVVVVRQEHIRRILGVAIKDAGSILSRLGFGVEPLDGDLKVTVPAYRPDITRSIDVIEEIARMYGFENIPLVIPPLMQNPEISSRYDVREIIKSWLEGMGLLEVQTYSFASQTHAQAFEDVSFGTPVEVANPIQQDEPVLRTTLLPNLIRTSTLNMSRQAKGIQIFEVGNVFATQKDQKDPEQQERMAVLFSGQASHTWNHKATALGYYDLKGVLEALFARLSLDVSWTAFVNSTVMHPGQSAQILCNEHVIGYAGLLHPLLAHELGLDQDVVVAELFMEPLYRAYTPVFQALGHSSYPTVQRDLSFVLPQEIAHQDIVKAVENAKIGILQSVEIFDVFEGKKVPQGHRSVAYRFVFGSKTKTLKDKEVDKAMNKVESVLQKFKLQNA